jgi:lipoprotein NlpD
MEAKARSGLRSACLVPILLGLAACNAPGPAPVIDGIPGGAPAATAATRPEAKPQPKPQPKAEPARPVASQIAPSTNGLHTVQRGETLYAVAFANSLDYREIASWNKLESADRILVGQVLRLTPPPGAVEVKPLADTPEPSARALVDPPLIDTPQAVLLAYSPENWAQVADALKDSDAPKAAATPVEAKPQPPAPEAKPVVAAEPPPAAAPAPAPATSTVDAWLWPTEGKLIGRFGAAGGKGIDIVGQRNAPVKAAAPGKVVYSGSGLRGYGRLLIVKHAGEFLSAYAHNETILVKEGDTVSAGQKIALMGDSDADRVKLHFEIRRYGKPLDPLTYLPERT